jgi:aldehyde dehydrogenase (NAD+)
VTETLSSGGKLVYGGRRMNGSGYFVESTIITNARNDWPCVQTETFAPLLYIIEYEDLFEAILLHNGVAQGLASGI